MLRTLIFWSDRTFPDRRCITQRTGVFTAKLVSLETQISHQKGTEIPDESGIQRNWNLFLASAGRACSCPENLVKQCFNEVRIMCAAPVFILEACVLFCFSFFCPGFCIVFGHVS